MGTALFLLGAFSLQSLVEAGGGKTFTSPSIVVDLDLPASQRWDAAMQYYGAAGPQAIKAYFSSFTKDVPAAVLSLIKWAAARLDYIGNISADIKAEMKALAAGMHMDLGTIVALSYLYELRALGPKANTTGPLPPAARAGQGLCTSIVSQSASNGAVLHVRNMDWNLPNNVRNLTFKGLFQRGGKTVFEGACFLGFVGMASGFATPPAANGASRYGVTINERDEGGNLMLDALMAVFAGSYDPTHLLRHVFEKANNYQTALRMLKTTKLSAPAYYIISGEGASDGHVLTRNRESVKSDRAIDSKHWFVAQTNYDWDTQPPSYDNRRKYVLQGMAAIGSPAKATKASLLKVISTKPVENEHTSYQTVMNPSLGTFDVYTHLKP